MFQARGIPTESTNLTFERFIDEYFGPVAAAYDKGRYDRTVLIVKAAMPFFKGKPMRAIKAADVERFKLSRITLPTMHDTPRKPATIEREMSIISSIFSMAVKNDVIDYNPCGRVQRLKFDNELDKVLRREDEDKFFANMHSEWAADICRMALNTSLRQNDIMRLTRFQVDLANNQLIIVQGKTTRRQIVRLNDVTREIIERRMKGKYSLLFASPVTGTEKGSVRHAMLRACERAKIPPLTIRDLRRTCLTRVVEDGTDAVTASRMAGHVDTRMISRYVKSVELLQRAVDNLAEVRKLKVVK